MGVGGAIVNEKTEFISRHKHVNISFTFLATQTTVLVDTWQMISSAQTVICNVDEFQSSLLPLNLGLTLG